MWALIQKNIISGSPEPQGLSCGVRVSWEVWHRHQQDVIAQVAWLSLRPQTKAADPRLEPSPVRAGGCPGTEPLPARPPEAAAEGGAAPGQLQPRSAGSPGRRWGRAPPTCICVLGFTHCSHGRVCTRLSPCDCTSCPEIAPHKIRKVSLCYASEKSNIHLYY